MGTMIAKYVFAGLLFAAWGGLVLMGKAPADSFVAGVQAALVGLGVFHMRGSDK